MTNDETSPRPWKVSDLGSCAPIDDVNGKPVLCGYEFEIGHADLHLIVEAVNEKWERDRDGGTDA